MAVSWPLLFSLFPPSVNSASRWKLHDLTGHVEGKQECGQLFPFITITESWLKSYFSDAQLQIPGSSISRCDRSKRRPSVKLLVAVVYRPPDASHSNFSQLIDHLKYTIDNLADRD